MSSTTSDTAGFDKLTKAIHAQTEKFTGVILDLGGQIHRDHDLEGKVDSLKDEIGQIKLSIKDNQIASNTKHSALEREITEMAGNVRAVNQRMVLLTRLIVGMITLFCGTAIALLIAEAAKTGG